MSVKLHRLKYYFRHFLTANRRGHGVHSPFGYQLCEEVFYNEQPFYDFEKLSSVRQQLLNDGTLLDVGHFGAGSSRMKQGPRKVSAIATHGVSSRRQSEILYRLCNFLACRTVLELGTSVGLNTLYLAKSNGNSMVTSVEGSPALAAFAKNLAGQNNVHNIRQVVGEFDEVLPGLLKENTPDLVYIDGNHTFEATMRYFELILRAGNSNSVFVFDDIYWSKGMTEAWQQIKEHPAVTFTIDTYFMGMVFFRTETREPTHLRLMI